jgi:hypothetical protein
MCTNTPCRVRLHGHVGSNIRVAVRVSYFSVRETYSGAADLNFGMKTVDGWTSVLLRKGIAASLSRSSTLYQPFAALSLCTQMRLWRTFIYPQGTRCGVGGMGQRLRPTGRSATTPNCTITLEFIHFQFIYVPATTKYAGPFVCPHQNDRTANLLRESPHQCHF